MARGPVLRECRLQAVLPEAEVANCGGKCLSRETAEKWYTSDVFTDGYLQKEKEFYARIKKYRVDPSSSSMANPVPDFYGEKIGSVKDYRRWLKDQRAFNLKRGRML
jgi:hypothetical protein